MVTYGCRTPFPYFTNKYDRHTHTQTNIPCLTLSLSLSLYVDLCLPVALCVLFCLFLPSPSPCLSYHSQLKIRWKKPLPQEESNHQQNVENVHQLFFSSRVPLPAARRGSYSCVWHSTTAGIYKFLPETFSVAFQGLWEQKKGNYGSFHTFFFFTPFKMTTEYQQQY